MKGAASIGLKKAIMLWTEASVDSSMGGGCKP